MNFFQRTLLRMAGVHARQLSMSTLLSMGGDGASSRAWSYGRYSEDGYRKNPVVNRCISLKMEACQAVGLCLELDGEEYDEGNPVPAALAPLDRLLKRPNPNQSMDEFVARWVLHMDLGGSAPVQAIGVGTDTVGQTVRVRTSPELWLKRPDTVTVNTNSDGTLKDYTYKQGATTRTFSTDEMMVWRYPHPDSEFEGLSPLASIEDVIDAHSMSIRWNRSLLKNFGRLSGMLLLKGLHVLAEPEQRRIEAEVRDQIQGTKNAGQVFVGAAEGMEYQQMGSNASDIDWLNGKRDFMRDICNALKTPSKMLNDPEAGTYANYAEARRAFYTDTVLPLMGYFVSELNEWLVPKYGVPGLRIKLKTQHIDALREDENAKYARMSTVAAQRVLTLNEIRDELGKGPIDGGDEIMAPAAVFPQQASFRRVPMKARWDQTKDARDLVADYTLGLRKPLRRMTRRVVEALDKAGVIERYRQTLVGREARTPEDDAARLKKMAGPVIESIEFDADDVAEEYTRAIWGSASTLAFGKLGAELTWNIKSPAVDAAVKSRQNAIKGVNDTQKDAILDTIRTVMYEEGGSPVTPAVLTRIDQIAGGKADYEAERIARTEALVVASTAQHTTFRENGAARKVWVHSGSDYPRHQGLDGEEVEIDEPFSNGLMYPGDPNGPEDEVINCQCSLAPSGVVEPDEWVTE